MDLGPPTALWGGRSLCEKFIGDLKDAIKPNSLVQVMRYGICTQHGSRRKVEKIWTRGRVAEMLTWERRVEMSWCAMSPRLGTQRPSRALLDGEDCSWNAATMRYANTILCYAMRCSRTHCCVYTVKSRHAGAGTSRISLNSPNCDAH